MQKWPEIQIQKFVDCTEYSQILNSENFVLIGNLPILLDEDSKS